MVDSHDDGVKPFFDVGSLAVVELTAQLTTREGSQIARSIDEKLCVRHVVFLSEEMENECVKYKAEAKGLFVDTTNPKHTSKRCAEYGFVHDDNCPSRDTFECQQCGNRNHADHNAAKNVADVYLRREQQFSRGRGSVNTPSSPEP